MLFAYPLTASKMVGTDMFHAAVLLWVAGISHLLHGDVDKHAIAWLLVGSIPGVLLGSHLSIRVPEQAAAHRFRDRAAALRDQARRTCRRRTDVIAVALTVLALGLAAFLVWSTAGAGSACSGLAAQQAA